jgi:hypothetical protein
VRVWCFAEKVSIWWTIIWYVYACS